MKIYKEIDYNDISRRGANIISSQIIINPYSVLGLATGASPIGIYNKLIEKYKCGDLDFSNISTVNLDEYKGLSPKNTQSYYYFMWDNLFKHINIKSQNTHIPNGMAENTELECKRYDKILESLGKIDIQLLGIGVNGHIGFNEPNDNYSKGTYCVKLSQSTIQSNSKYFNPDVEMPTYAYTMGIKSIMSAKKILLVAYGINKAQALYNCIYGPITPKIPASILQLHTDVTIIADYTALSLIK